ncbi:calcium/proton exchanger [Methylomonas sp. MgM2]
MNLKWLLVFVPVALLSAWLEANPIFVFIVSALAVVPLAGMMGDATEVLARYLGPSVGGLLNASLGNAPEIIIGFFALKHGLVEMVKASISGAIIGNLLFGLGVSILAGGLKSPERNIEFNPASVRVHVGSLLLAVFGLIIPAVFNFSTESEHEISLHIAILLFLFYLMSIAVTLMRGTQEDETEWEEESASGEINWSRNKALGFLAILATGLAIMSEIMTDAIEPAAKSLGFTPLFAGVFFLAMVGNVAELINSVRFARQGKLDISMSITAGGSAQIALLVVPLLMFFGLMLGQNMNLLFSKFELVALILTVLAVVNMLQLGSVRWGAGVWLIMVYIMLGVGFFYAPASTSAG